MSVKHNCCNLSMHFTFLGDFFFLDLCNRTAEQSKLFPFPPSYCDTTKTAPAPDLAKFAYEDVQVKPPSYLDAVCRGLTVSASVDSNNSTQQLCPFAVAGECHYGDSCLYLHGDVCEVCGLQVLHPTDFEQRRAHEQASIAKPMCLSVICIYPCIA